jgi:dienelactone hydrolase
MRIVSVCLTLVFFWTMSFAQEIDYKGFPQWSWGKKDSTEYFLYTPADIQKGKKYPLVLFLHGCCGQDYHATLRNAVDPPVRVWHNFGENTQTIPTFIISPKTSQGWSQHFANLKFVIDDLVAKGSVDPQRLYISGFSMGARGTWEFIEAYPGFFAAAIAMGMNFKGKEYQNFKNIPVWAIRGDQDWWARHLGTQISKIRNLSMPGMDSAEWITGVNPRLTNYEGMGHVVMWPAVNEPDYRSWLYSKINDGNNYPSVMLRKPAQGQQFRAGDEVLVEADARDPDGRIAKAEVLVNGKKIRTITEPPYAAGFSAEPGDTEILVRVFDDKGKTTEASGKIWVDVPLRFATTTLTPTRAGDYFSFRIQASGNGVLTYALVPGESLPEGIRISQDGTLYGVPVQEGDYVLNIIAMDDDGDSAQQKYNWKVERKSPGAILISNARTYKGESLPLSKVQKGITPHIRADNEVTFSSIPSPFEGLTLIQTPVMDTITSKPYFLQFETDEPVTVFVAYEKLDNLFHSTVPSWLNDFRKEKGQIVAQYFYYDIYAKDFPKGKVSLPDAEEQKHGVNTNYFIMVRKK